MKVSAEQKGGDQPKNKTKPHNRPSSVPAQRPLSPVRTRPAWPPLHPGPTGRRWCQKGRTTVLRPSPGGVSFPA
eukprot:4552110-Lingulodinium_polyedra.AAC.1